MMAAYLVNCFTTFRRSVFDWQVKVITIKRELIRTGTSLIRNCSSVESMMHVKTDMKTNGDL